MNTIFNGVNCNIPNASPYCGPDTLTSLFNFTHGIGDWFTGLAQNYPVVTLAIALPLAAGFYNVAGSRVCNTFAKPRRDSTSVMLQERQIRLNEAARINETPPQKARLTPAERIAHAVPNNAVMATAVCASLLLGTTITDLAVYQRFGAPERLGAAFRQGTTLNYLNDKTKAGLNWVSQAVLSLG